MGKNVVVVMVVVVPSSHFTLYVCVCLPLHECFNVILPKLYACGKGRGEIVLERMFKNKRGGEGVGKGKCCSSDGGGGGDAVLTPLPAASCCWLYVLPFSSSVPSSNNVLSDCTRSSLSNTILPMYGCFSVAEVVV